jgi:hypothetical protein
VLIAPPALLPALKQRTTADGNELLAFTDSDALRALDTITKRRPSIVAVERTFAATPRGAALINRIKADPSLATSEVRVISHDNTFTRVATGPPSPPSTPAASIAAISDAPTEIAQALDESGTRGSPRMMMVKGVDVLVDGNPAVLVDLSVGGAQVLSAAVLKPNQRVRITLTDEGGTLRITGTIAWATFEIPPRYRAGIEFIDGGNSAAIEAYALRHKA